ncbi:MAG: hypothetical protein F4Z85_01350 [Gemmatimonadetes bacterium]|nr:hypothetical protein [Gemmatimonadota bacterium]
MRLTNHTARRENIFRNLTGFALIICTLALLTWALPTFGHDTPDIRSGVEKHVSPEEVQQIVNEERNSLADYINDHWHMILSGPYEGQIGGTPICIADSYDPETDEYGRWDEETYSWDLSGCGDESTSEDPSTTTSTDEQPSTTAPPTDEDSQNEEVAGNTLTEGTTTTPTDEQPSTITSTDEQLSTTTPTQTLVETSGEEEDSEQAFGFAGAVEDQAYTAETAITALVMPDATGGEGEVTYRVFGLPAGLSFDAATRTISGTPTAATDGAVEVACLAEDSIGAVAVLFFSITVNPPLSFGDFS